MRGRKPKPSALKRLSGNPGKRKLNTDEPRPPASEDLMVPSRWLDKVAASEWRRIAVTLKTLGLLTNLDRAALEGYCKAYSRWLQAEKILEKEGLCFVTPKGYVQQRPEVAIAKGYLSHMHSLAAEFGFTPASRSRVKGSGSGDGDEVDDFLKKRPGAKRPEEEQRLPEPGPDGPGSDAPGRSLH